MTLFDLLILLLVAGICGALGQAITGFSRGGCLVSIALGFVGVEFGATDHRHPTALARETQGNGVADAATGSGDDGNLIGETHVGLGMEGW